MGRSSGGTRVPAAAVGAGARCVLLMVLQRVLCVLMVMMFVLMVLFVVLRSVKDEGFVLVAVPQFAFSGFCWSGADVTEATLEDRRLLLGKEHLLLLLLALQLVLVLLLLL